MTKLRELSVLPLREEIVPFRGEMTAGWTRSQLSPQALWSDVTNLKRAVTELQDRLQFFIDRFNDCKECQGE